MFFKKNNEINVLSPVDGKIKKLEKVNDPVFSEKMLGDGVAVEPITSDVYAPFDGKLTVLFPTGHALGVKHKNGPESLIHIGINTVSLKGECFASKVKANDNVTKSTILTTVDFKKIKAKKIITDIILIITSESIGNYKIVDIAEGNIKQGEVLYKLVKK